MHRDLNLYPCPFCGSYNVTEVTENHPDVGKLHYISCLNCFAQGPQQYLKDDDLKFHKLAWNNRCLVKIFCQVEQRIEDN